MNRPTEQPAGRHATLADEAAATAPDKTVDAADTRDEGLRADAVATLAASEVLHTAAEVQAAYDAMADAIRQSYSGKVLHVLCVMNGGLIACAELLRRLRLPLTLDYIHASRYRNRTSGSELLWKVRPPAGLQGQHVLLVDDILDEGHTLVGIRAAVAACHPASLRVAVLADKGHDRRAEGADAEFVGLTLPDRYVFGNGMDYRGFWRQLPEIRAVAEGPRRSGGGA